MYALVRGVSNIEVFLQLRGMKISFNFEGELFAQPKVQRKSKFDIALPHLNFVHILYDTRAVGFYKLILPPNDRRDCQKQQYGLRMHFVLEHFQFNQSSGSTV